MRIFERPVDQAGMQKRYMRGDNGSASEKHAEWFPWYRQMPLNAERKSWAAANCVKHLESAAVKEREERGEVFSPRVKARLESAFCC